MSHRFTIGTPLLRLSNYIINDLALILIITMTLTLALTLALIALANTDSNPKTYLSSSLCLQDTASLSQIPVLGFMGLI